jgi:hypothetical protein
MSQLGTFEQNLLTELREVVRLRGAPRPPRLPVRRGLALAAGGGALAAAAVLGPPALGGDSTPAAYAVEANDDGSLTVTIERFEDADGLERQLAQHGVSAVVDYVPYDKRCQQPRYDPRQAGLPDGAVDLVDWGHDLRPPDYGVSLTLRPDLLGDRTLVITQSKAVGTTAAGEPYDELVALARGVTAVAGPVAPCVLEDW